ncbi:MAG: hypothetical protein ACFFFT_14390 [Candidatus Thorarchaeota archaeon]
MVQVCEKSMFEMEVKEAKEKAAQEANEKEVDELLGDLNPRYFERVMSLREAKQRNLSSYQVQAKMNLNSFY